MGGSKEDGPRLLSVVPASRTREKGEKLKHGKLHLNIGEHSFHCERHQTLEQVVQRGCGFLTPGHIQNPTRHSPEQPSFKQGVGPNFLQRCLPVFTIL